MKLPNPKYTYRQIRWHYVYYRRVLRTKAKLPLSKKLWAWRHGFFADTLIYNQLDEHNYSNYLSDFARFTRATKINRGYEELLDNKLSFQMAFSKYEQYFPRILAYNRGGRLIFAQQVDGTAEVLRCVRASGIVIKPIGGGGGKNIYIARGDDSGYSVNGDATTVADLLKLITSKSGYFLSEYIQQAEYARRIFPATANSLRIVTCWDYERGEPYIARAVHRFGSARSGAVDNFQKGGVACVVDIESGKLDAGAYKLPDRIEFYAQHPESKMQLEGVQVANWQALKQGLLELCRHLFFVPYIGWDIVVTDDGFKAIEGNINTGIDVLQLRSGLLEDERTRAFFEHHGVI